MSRNEDNLNGAMTGIAIAAAAHWARYDDDTQRRLHNVRLDAEEALDLIRDMQNRGEVVRSRLPTVMDALVGTSIAKPAADRRVCRPEHHAARPPRPDHADGNRGGRHDLAPRARPVRRLRPGQAGRRADIDVPIADL